MKKKKDEKKIKNSRALANNLYMVKYIVKNAPFYFFCDIFLKIMTSVPWTLSRVWLLKYVIDVVTEGANLFRILYAVLIFAAIILVSEFTYNWFKEIYAAKKAETLYQKMQSRLYEKATGLDIASYDDQKFYNDFILAMETSNESVQNVMRYCETIADMVVTTVSITAILATIDPVCLLIILVSAFLIIPLNRKCADITLKRREEENPVNRKLQYFSRVFTLPDNAKEIRLNRVSPLLMSRYAETTEEMRGVTRKWTSRNWKMRMSRETLPFTLCVCFGVMAYMGYQVIVKKEATLSGFVAAFTGADELSYCIYGISGYAMYQMQENGLFIEKFRAFLSCKPSINGIRHPKVTEKPETIRLEDVSFTYPGNDTPSLKNITMEIPGGSKVALVGYNGAGKTTLTNLLLRLYDIKDGIITVNGEDIREADPKAHRERFAAVFQDYRLFAATLGENVAMNDMPERESVLTALSKSGFDKELQEGTDSQLLREFSDSGVLLSGGESQKVAIARVFYKNSPYIILDEPSSNLDPISEYNLNSAIARSASDKTVVFISHRLSTTRMADKIYMMEQGEIIESGTHDELMKQNGKYAYMFSLQAEKYMSEECELQL